MKVEVTEAAYFDGRHVLPGETLELESADQFSHKWMEAVDFTPPPAPPKPEPRPYDPMRKGPPWRRIDAVADVIDGMRAEIAELKRQLAAAKAPAKKPQRKKPEQGDESLRL